MKFQILIEIDGFIRGIYYHRKHKKKALSTLKKIEEDTDFSLSNKMKKIIKSYAVKVHGSKKYAPWLYVYTAYNKEFKIGWMPDNLFGEIIANEQKKSKIDILRIKTMSAKIINSPLYSIDFYRINGHWYDFNYQKIDYKHVFETIKKTQAKYFLKNNLSARGEGVKIVNSININSVLMKQNNDFVLQREIRMHPWFKEIGNNGYTTLRINTLRANNGEIIYSGAFLRIPMYADEIVNDKSVKIAVINDFGELSHYGLDENWHRVYRHPQSNIVFDKQIIPHFRLCVEECRSAHKNMPHFRILGWDVAVDEESKVKIMEVNANHPDIKFIESHLGPKLQNFV